MENIIISINCVLPIFIILSVGYLIKLSRIVPEETFKHLNKICFMLFIPVMLFMNIYNSKLGASFPLGTVVFLLLSIIVPFVVGYGIFPKTVPDAKSRAVYLQVLYRSNIAVIGIALAQVLMDSHGVYLMTVAISTMVPIYNIMAVIAFESCRGETIKPAVMLKNICKNPLLLATLLGGIFLLLGIHLPKIIEHTLGQISRCSSVMTLLSLGASLSLTSLKKNMGVVMEWTLVRLVLMPAIIIFMAIKLGFTGSSLATIMLCASTPLATTTFTMAQAYDSNYEVAGQLVVSTSLFCSFTLFLWIFLLKELSLI